MSSAENSLGMSPVDNSLNKMKGVVDESVHAFLNNLSNVTSKSTINVRITRLWDTLNINKRKSLISTDMVLMDEKHNYIHGTIPSRSASLFKNILQEGKMYVIEDFTVSKNKGKYTVVQKNTSMLQFSAATKFTIQEYDDGKIPRYIFEFVPFEELHKQLDKEVHADVIGVIVDVTPIEERTTAHGKVNMMSLYLTNESGCIFKVTLWDDYVSTFGQKLKKYKHASPKPDVAIFTSILVKQFQGEVYVQSSRSTTIYVNIDIPQTIELIQSSKAANVVDENAKLSTLAVRPKILEVKTISEIFDMAASGINMSAVYRCAATVVKISMHSGWYYVSCPDCRKTLRATGSGFCCENCQKEDVPYPKARFRLALEVKDSTYSTEMKDSTYTPIFVLFDEVAEQFLQVKLADLSPNLEDENGKNSELPAQLLQIIGSTHVFQIKMSSYYKSVDRKSFTANKILKPVVKIEKEDNIDNVCSSSSVSPTLKTPILRQKRRKLILHSSPESDDKDQKDFVEDLDD